MSLFEALGGEPGISRFVDELDRRLLADPELGPMFVGVDGAGLQRHREHYFAAVLGGPEQYAGRGLRDAHRHVGIDDAQFDRFLAIADESLAAVSAGAAAADDVRDLLARLRPVVVAGASGSISRPGDPDRIA
jgi:hemoglobin